MLHRLAMSCLRNLLSRQIDRLQAWSRSDEKSHLLLKAGHPAALPLGESSTMQCKRTEYQRAFAKHQPPISEPDPELLARLCSFNY